MPRPPRIDYEGAWHHVMNRGRNRQDIFRTDNDRRYLLSRLGEANRRFGVEFHAFALMPNHLHLLVHTPRACLSQAMHLILGTHAQRMNRMYGTDGALFKGRFHSIHIDDERYLVEVVRYIHNNPVKAGLVRAAVDYRWSSHRSILGLRRAPTFLNTTTIIDTYFGGELARFAEFVDARTNNAYRSLADIIEHAPDIARLSEVLAERASRSIVGMARSQIECYVSRTCGVPRDSLKRPVRGRNNDAVFLVMKLLHHHGAATMRQLASEFGYSSHAGVVGALQRFDTRAANDRALGAALAAGMALVIADAA